MMTCEQKLKSGILADDMEIGKTSKILLSYNVDISIVQLLRLIFETQSDEDEPTLILCPKSVIVTWSENIKKCFRHCKVSIDLEENNKPILGIEERLQTK